MCVTHGAAQKNIHIYFLEKRLYKAVVHGKIKKLTSM